MNANFDLLVSGCNTRCAHCYVNGGPGGLMRTEDALFCIDWLDELASLLPFEASFTLDNEPMNHPDIALIVKKAASVGHIEYFHHGMTSGIALVRRPDREEVLRTYLECGFREFGITVHGNAAHHDGIVRREGAYRLACEAAALAKNVGAEVSVSLMFNRFFAEDADDIDGLTERLAPSSVWFAIPNYTPHVNMPGYEGYRGTEADLEALSPMLEKWGVNAEALLKEARTVARLREELIAVLDPAELFARPQEELYLSIRQNGDLYVGNTGAETELLGNIRALDPAAAAGRIARLPGNRDFGAFYEADRIPGRETLVSAAERLPGELLYSDLPSALYRVLAELGIPTRIIKP